MDDKKLNNDNLFDSFDESLESLRQDEQREEAPSVQGEKRIVSTYSRNRLAMIVRVLIAFLILLIAGQIWYIWTKLSEPRYLVFEGGPPTAVYYAPVEADGFATPTVEPNSTDVDVIDTGVILEDPDPQLPVEDPFPEELGDEGLPVPPED